MKEEKSIMRIRLHPYDIVIAIGVVVFLVCAFNLNGNKDYGIMGTYKEPMCIVDLHTFESDTCPECGEPISEVGVFYRSGETYNYEIEDDGFRLHFVDLFETYEGYASVRKELIMWSTILLCSLIVMVGGLVLRVVRRKRK